MAFVGVFVVFGFLSVHFPLSTFNGRLQVGCRSPRTGHVHPAHTFDYQHVSELQDFRVYPTADYYITANSFSGLNRSLDGLFSLHNLVIDIDCHGVSGGLALDIEALLWRLQHDVWGMTIPSPTSIVYTGRGLQLWWSITGISSKFKTFYDELLDLMISCLETFIVASGKGLFDDFSMFHVDSAASRNAIGFFRLPGTFNTKTGAYVTYEVIGPSYDLMDLFEQMKSLGTEAAPLPDTLSPPSYSDDSSLPAFGKFEWIAQAERRVESLLLLRELRGASTGAEERNNLSFMIYNALVPCYGHEVAYARMADFNKGFKVPLSQRELNAVICTAKKKNGYQYTTPKMMEFLGITEDESRQINLVKDSIYLNKRKRSVAQTATKKQARDAEIISLYSNGLTLNQVGQTLNLNIKTVQKVVNSLDSSRKSTRKEKILTLLSEGKTSKEIADLCNCSERTVQRALC